MRDTCQDDYCDRPATRQVIVHIEGSRPSAPGYSSAVFCTEHAADIAHEIATGEPPNFTVVAVVALIPTQHDGSTQ